MKVDLCFVLDCTGSMQPHIAAAKDCILQVLNYVKHVNPSIKPRVGFCGYRDHYNRFDRLQIFDFNYRYDQFTQYMQNVLPIGNDDLPEDVLGGLNAAITQMNWKSDTRVLLHIGDYPPHGRRFSNIRDKYPNGSIWLNRRKCIKNDAIKKYPLLFWKNYRLYRNNASNIPWYNW